MDMMFEQHADIDLEVPYLQMVEISVDADHVDFADNPAMWMGHR